MTDSDDNKDSMKTLRDFRDDCRELDLEAFSERHGEGFFLHRGTADSLKAPTMLQSTEASDAREPGSKAPFIPQDDFLVFPVRRSDNLKDTELLVFIGRNQASDVSIPDASISGTHGIVKRSKDGGFLFRDFGSINGTFIDDEAAPVQGIGDLVEIRSGSRVRFGSVEMTFLRAAEFYALVNSLFA